MPGTYQYDVEIKSNVAKLLSDMKQVQDRLDTVEGKEYKIKLNVDEKKLSSVISNLEKMLDSLGKGTGDFKRFENLSKELSSIVSEVQSFSKAFGKVDDSGTKTLLSSIQNIDKSLSELSQNILNVNKNMGNMGVNTNGAVKQVENISNAYQNAAKEAEKLADAQSKIGQKTNISSGRKDAFPKTSENLEQVAQSEQKVQQEAVATDKALDNISFTPNTEGFDDIIAKFGILREQAEQITKIVKTTKQTADGMTNISYKATLRNGSSYYLGENSTPQVLNASETVYDAKAVAEQAKQEAKAIQAEWDKNVKAIQDYIDAVTKLNNLRASDKGTGKKSYEIAGQIEEIEKLKKEAYDARQVLSSMVNPHSGDIDTWNKWLEVMNKFDQASLGSAESVNRLKDSLKNVLNSELNSLQGSIDKYQKIITQAQIHPSDFHPSTEYNTKLTKLESANEALKNYKVSLQGVTELTKDQQAEINRLTQNCEKAATEFKKLSAAEKGTTEVGVEKAIQRINKDLAENTKYSAEAKAGLNALLVQLKSGDPSINLRKITEEIIRIENAEIAAGRAGKSLWDIFKTKSTYGFIGQMQSFLSMYVGFYGMINAARKVGSTLVELDTTLVDLKKTTEMNSTQLEQYYYDANDVAKQMGVTTQAIIEQSSAWSRLGYNTAETSTEMAKLSSQFASISPGMEVGEAQSGLVSIMKAWSIDPEQVKSEIIDPINQLGNTMAENNQDIVEGMERSAAALAAVGTSTKDAYALFSGIQEVLQNSEKSGTSLRSVALRLRSFDESTEEYSSDLANITGELVDLTKTAEHAQGVSVFKPGSTTEFKSLVDYFREIADIWDEMSQKQQNDFLLKAFGRTQAQAGAALIQNFKGVEKALDVMDESAGSADKEMDTIKSSLEYKLNTLQETWTGTIQNIMKRSDLGFLIDGLTKVSEGIGTVTSNLGLLKTAALGVTAVLSARNNVGKCYVSA